MVDIKPNHTIYINNLNEKVKKDGLLFLKILYIKPFFRIKKSSSCNIFAIWYNFRYFSV